MVGRATISSGANSLTVTQSSNTGIINWQSFSVGQNNSVIVNNGSGATLNRVTGGNASQIAGSLSATGTIYLINPAGVVIDSTGKVVTGGSFVASTGDTSDDAFGNGTKHFTNANGSVVNNGKIVSANGDAILIGNSVQNSGSISAVHGTAALAAGTDVIVRPQSASQRIFVKAGTGDATNSGTIEAASAEIRAAGGNVYALAGNTGGIIHATGGQKVAGHVWLTSGTGDVQAGGTITATNTDGSGGVIVATGKSVAITADANLDVSGTSGGTILIGGDAHGGAIASKKLIKQAVATASTTSVAAGAGLNADGSAGNGGNVVVWSNNQTDFSGAISARGGAGKSGGFAEVSSHDLLGYHGSVDLSAPGGSNGSLLLDPRNVVIQNSSTSNGAIVKKVFTPTGDDSVLSTSDLDAALAKADVTVTTGATGSQVGNITVAGEVDWANGSTLTLNAANAISIVAPIFNSAGKGSVVLTAGGTISESGNGYIVAANLSGSGVGGVSLGGANQISTLNGFTNSGNGGLSLNDLVKLTVKGAVDAGNGSLSLATGTSFSSSSTSHSSSSQSASSISAGSSTAVTADLTILAPLTWAGSNSLSLTASGDLSIQAAVIGDPYNANASLVAGGKISESGAGAIAVLTLTGSSGGATILGGANTIANLAGFNAGGTGGFLLNDNAALIVSDIVRSGGNLTLASNSTASSSSSARGNGAGALTILAPLFWADSHTLSLQSNGPIEIGTALTGGGKVVLASGDAISEDNGASIIANSLSGSAVGGINLNGLNQVAFLDGFTNAGGGGLSFTDAAKLTVRGAVDAGYGNLTLITTNSSGVTPTVPTSSPADGSVPPSDPNGLVILAPVTLEGGNTLTFNTDGRIRIESLISNPSGAVNMTAYGAIVEKNDGAIYADSFTGMSNRRTELTGDNQINTLHASQANGPRGFLLNDDVSLVVDGAVNATNGRLVLTAGQAIPMSSGSSSAAGGGGNPTSIIILAPLNWARSTTLSLVASGDIDIQSGLSSLTGNGAANLQAGGAITESGNGAILAQSLSGLSGGATTLLGNNQIGDLKDFQAGSGGLSLNDAAALAVRGSVAASGDPISLESAQGIRIAGALSTSGAVTMVSGDNVVENSNTGTITAGTLSVSAQTGINLQGANHIGVVLVDTTASGPDKINNSP